MVLEIRFQDSKNPYYIPYKSIFLYPSYGSFLVDFFPTLVGFIGFYVNSFFLLSHHTFHSINRCYPLEFKVLDGFFLPTNMLVLFKTFYKVIIDFSYGFYEEAFGSKRQTGYFGGDKCLESSIIHGISS